MKNVDCSNPKNADKDVCRTDDERFLSRVVVPKGDKNPSLAKVLADFDGCPLFAHVLSNAFVTRVGDALVVNVEAYDRQITVPLFNRIYKIAKINEKGLLKKFGGTHLEIEGHGVV